MSKVARLIGVSLLTRVIVDEHCSDDELSEIAVRQFIDKLNDEGVLEHMDQNDLDLELPYGEGVDDLVTEPTIPVTLATIKLTCGWSKFCDVTGSNHYMLKEFQVEDSKVFYVKEFHAKKLGLARML